MAYELDISSETAKTASDLVAGQALIVIDAATDTAKLIAKDSAGDSFDVTFAQISSVPVKATGAEVDTGTNDTKFVTAKAMEDSAYAKVVAASAFIADPVGGATSDTEARAAIVAILDLLIARGDMAAA